MPGALGSMPVPALDAAGRRDSQQLIRSASIYVLERTLKPPASDPRPCSGGRPTTGATIGRSLDGWIEEVADASR